MPIINTPKGIVLPADTGSDILAPPDGSLWYNPAQKALRGSAPASGIIGLGGVQSSSILLANSNAITANTETAFTQGAANAVISIPVQVNALTAGKILRISAGGIYSSAATPGTILYRYRYGQATTDTSMGNTNNATMSASMTNQPWHSITTILCRNAGSAAVIATFGFFILNNSSTGDGLTMTMQPGSAGTSTIDNTKFGLITLFVTFSLNTASITMTYYLAEYIN